MLNELKSHFFVIISIRKVWSNRPSGAQWYESSAWNGLLPSVIYKSCMFTMALLTNADLSSIDSEKHISVKFWSKSKDCKMVSICWDLNLLKGYQKYRHWRWTSASKASIALTIVMSRQQWINNEKKTKVNKANKSSRDILPLQHYYRRSCRKEISYSNDETLNTRSVFGFICYQLLIMWNGH